MKVLKVFARIFLVLSTLVLAYACFASINAGYDTGAMLSEIFTFSTLIVLCHVLGVVFIFTSEDGSILRKVANGLLLGTGLIGIGVGIAGIGSAYFSAQATMWLISGSLVSLAYLFIFIAYLVGGSSSPEAALDDKIEQLNKINMLLEKKIITQDEFDEMRVKILGIQKKKK